MKPNKGNRKWLLWGSIIIGLGCIGVVVLFGGLAAIGALFGNTPPTQSADFPTTAPLSDINSQPTVTPQQVMAATSTPLVRPIPFDAVVQIVAMYYDESNQLVPGWTGSGSLITPDGLILTNAHVILSDRYYRVDALGVAFTDREDQSPELRYFAEVLQVDETLDIAVIKITADLYGNPVDYASLNFPYVPLGNADDLRLGDQITILGYPGIGGETITLTRGEVSGFTSEAGRGDRAFIKTSATIAGGNSGGLAADAAGYLIGIPTQLGYGGEDQYVDCRVLADTNRDGYIDERDNCIPTGGFINALRPINLALPLIEAAQAGVVTIETAPVATVEVDVPQGSTVLYEDDFSTVKGNWDYTGSAGVVSHIDGELQVEITETDYFLWGMSGGSYNNTVIDADVRTWIGAGDGDYGIICRYQDNENFYGFEISEDGYYTIWKYFNAEYTALVDWQYSPQVEEVASGAHLTVTCSGDLLALSINGQWLAEARDSDLAYGDIGVIAGTWTNAPLIVRFDNLVIVQTD